MDADTNKEEIVISWLKTHGYFRVETNITNRIFLEADGKMRRMVVAVSDSELNLTTKNNIKKIAIKNNREAWVALVEPEDNDISWSVID